MPFLFLLVVLAAVALLKLGALSVWVIVLGSTLQILVYVLAGVGTLLGLRAWMCRRDKLSLDNTQARQPGDAA